ncbi:phage virion morphogenesis protein [Azonexus hydrophilus]|uniref:Phage virion morphogenesis protein n=1 Tax=Azonexus hydrophilus TaxID=418702 RepID=A0ABZ2XCQ6_9RHOO
MSQNDPLPALDAFAADLIANLEPGARRQLAAEIAKALQRRQAQRIAAQENPDGTPYEPRKPQMRRKQGRIRRTMFAKLRTARYLKAASTPEESVVRFVDSVARIAAVHHGGLRDYVNRRRALQIDYPKRELLGFTEADIDLIREITTDHLAGRE